MGNFFELFNLSDSLTVDPIGRVGGIWVVWNLNNVNIQSVYLSPKAIHMTVNKQSYEECFHCGLWKS